MFKHEDIPKFYILEYLKKRGVPPGTKRPIRVFYQEFYAFSVEPSKIDSLAQHITEYIQERFSKPPECRYLVKNPFSEGSWCVCKASYRGVDVEFTASLDAVLGLQNLITNGFPKNAVSKFSWFNKYYVKNGKYVGPAKIPFKVETIEGPLDMELVESMPFGGTLRGVSNLQNLRKTGGSLIIEHYEGSSLPSLEEIGHLSLISCNNLTSAPKLKRGTLAKLEQTPLYRVHPHFHLDPFIEAHIQEMERIKSLPIHTLVEELPKLKKHIEPPTTPAQAAHRIGGSSFRMAEVVIKGLEDG